MSKRNPFLFFIILIMLVPFPRADALGIGPPSFEMDLQMDGGPIPSASAKGKGINDTMSMIKKRKGVRLDINSNT